MVEQPSKDVIFQVTRQASSSNGDHHQVSEVLGKRKRQLYVPSSKPDVTASSCLPHHFLEGSSCYLSKEPPTMTLCDSTKVTSSLAAPPNFRSKRACHAMAQPNHLSSAAAAPPAGADITDCPLSEMPAEAALGHPEESSSCLFGPGSSDEKLIRALKSYTQSIHVIGVSSRKLRSLKFRLRRREIKMMQSGTPFNTRETAKNTNR